MSKLSLFLNALQTVPCTKDVVGENVFLIVYFCATFISGGTKRVHLPDMQRLTNRLADIIMQSINILAKVATAHRQHMQRARSRTSSGGHIGMSLCGL